MVTAAGVPRERVVAVEATLADGSKQRGTGFLVGGRLVLTAEHCTRDKETREPAVALRVVRAGAAGAVLVVGVAACPGLDVAVLTLGDDAPWDASLPAVAFARVDRRYSGMLENCEGIGYPLFQRNPAKGSRNTSEVHGTIYQTDEAETGRLLMREPLIRPGALSGHDTTGDREADAAVASPWGGLSGALLFHAGLAIGVVVEHHPRQGESALRAIGFEKIAKTAAADPAARQLAEVLGLPAWDELPWAAGDPVQPLAGLVDLLDSTDANDLPLVRNLNPYLLGATPTDYGSKDSSGAQDPYVPRTHQNVDARLEAALVAGQMVLLVGPSKAGKTRTAFEAIRTRWPHAHLLAPDTPALAALANHPRLRTGSDTIVVWLDDLQRYLSGIFDPLTPALLTALLSRPGPTVVLATLRTEERARLLRDGGELSYDARRVLKDATEVELGPTSDNPEEQQAAHAAYPDQDLSVYGLAEQLAGAPYLLQQYRDARHADPLLHAIIRTAIDWVRVGMPDPLPEKDLAALALDTLAADQPNIRTTSKKVQKAIETADTPPSGAGRVAALETILLPDRTRGYRPFSYLVAADDGQSGFPRPIPGGMWDQSLERATTDTAFAISIAAYERNNRDVAARASKQAANAGHTKAMFNLGALLARQDPPDLKEARTWYEQAANAGHTDAMFNLGVLLAGQDPPDRTAARTWYEQAANAGDTDAMFNLGALLAGQDPPDPDGARAAWQKIVDSGARGAAGFALTGAALSLAALEALAGNDVRSMELLELAGHQGAASAATYRATLNQNPRIRNAALLDLSALPGDSDALNFLGIASHSAGDLTQARQYWVTSTQLNDSVAPLLLHLTKEPTTRGP